MEKFEKTSRYCVVNLFADFILTKIGTDYLTKIEVIDFNSFFLINGLTNSTNKLDMGSVRDEFCEIFSEYLDSYFEKTFNVVDLVSYDQKMEINNFFQVEIKKPIYQVPISNSLDLSFKSSFPHGFSYNSGRLIYYYYLYIFNQISSTINSNQMKIKLQSIEEDIELEIQTKSMYKTETVKNLILDVFDFDLKVFEEKLENYNILEDIINQDGNKPYLVQDRLQDVIIF